ncbi:MAG TPA: signal recognition particle protein, partial [Clostridia bacterium]|nr:signal recognition particle protein [Clostridia bacterium]
TKLMGGANAKLTWSSSVPTIYLLCGLQGAGKTTMAGKLAGYLKKTGKKPLLAACDIYRPAAIKQLQVVGEKAGVQVFEKGTQDPVLTSKQAVDHARYYGHDVLIIDTAGRLHIDDTLMDELSRIKAAVRPQEILLTVDAMTGQDAVNVAKSFNEKLGIDGIIITKLDSDTRGGAALSARAITGKPIKFAGTGEKLSDIEPFHPDRMASRILGMGDVLTLIEKATESFEAAEAEKVAAKSKQPQDLSLDDFLEQLQQLKKMGPLQNVLGMLPGVGNKLKNVEVDENAMKKPEAIIRSMTVRERRNPDILNASRRKRIAAGAGVSVADVNQLMRQFEQMRKLLKQMTGNKRGLARGMRGIPFM